jgi:hypothetical protein
MEKDCPWPATAVALWATRCHVTLSRSHSALPRLMFPPLAHLHTPVHTRMLTRTVPSASIKPAPRLRLTVQVCDVCWSTGEGESALPRYEPMGHLAITPAPSFASPVSLFIPDLPEDFGNMLSWVVNGHTHH